MNGAFTRCRGCADRHVEAEFLCIHGSCSSVNGCKPHFLLTPLSRISAHFDFIGIRFTYGRELALAAHRPHVALHKATKHTADSPCFQTGSHYRPALLKYSTQIWCGTGSCLDCQKPLS